MERGKLKEKFIGIFGFGYTSNMKKLDEEYKYCEKELKEIFNKVVSNDKISTYKLSLYKIKMDALNFKVNKLLDSANNLQSSENKNITLLILTLLLVICISLIFINPAFGPIGYMIFLFSTMGMKLRAEGFAENDYKHLKKENNPILTLLNNCNTFLNKHFEKNKEVSSLPIKDLSDIDFADNIIRQYLDDGYLSNNIDSKIKEIVVKLLQDELKSEECDIEVLLNIAKENLELEKKKNKDNKMKRLL